MGEPLTVVHPAKVRAQVKVLDVYLVVAGYVSVQVIVPVTVELLLFGAPTGDS